jgi:glycosyltransferase involved in cell wall biosynthesis
MKILRVIASVDLRSGGPLEGLRLSAGKMAEWGHQTEVVSLDPPGSEAALGDLKLTAVGRWPKPYGYAPKLKNWLAEHASRFDVAVVHGLWNHASVGGGLALQRARLPYVVFAHGMMDPWFKQAHPLKHQLKQAFWTLWQGRVLAGAKAILFTSEQEMQSARGVFRGHSYRERLVDYGASEPGNGAPDTLAFRAILPGLGNRPYLLFLGRIHPKKGCDILVEAFLDLAHQFPEVDLVMAGPDEAGMKPSLVWLAERAGLAHRIHWPGMLAGSQKWGALRGAEAFVLPSHQENFGIAVAEALGAGVPVLISDKVDIWRSIQNAGAGLVAPDDRAGVVSILEEFMKMPQKAQLQMGQAGRSLFEARFSADAAARSLLAQLEAAIR